MLKDTSFYDKESKNYSTKRYPNNSLTYTHFFFKKRLELTKKFIRDIKNLNRVVIEMGCADGFVLRELYRENLIKNQIIGIDLSKEMIEVATKNSVNFPISFYKRGEEPNNLLANLIIEIGVINFTDLNTELEYAKNHIKDNGYFIVSFASKTSLTHKLKQSESEEYIHLEEPNFYKKRLSVDFNIIRSEPYGLFIPYIWRLPRMGRILQPIVEKIFKRIYPNLFHEQIYLAQKK